MEYCTRCILPEDYPGIVFDDKGLCGFCARYESQGTCLGKDKLVELLNSVTCRGKHDCVVPLSGGKDSVYVLYYAVKQLGLKPLALSCDAGFQTDLARENVRRATEILGVPLVTVTSKNNIRQRVVRQSLLVSEVFGSFVAVCGNCETVIRAAVMNVAREHDIPFVLWGASSIESSDYTRYRRGRSLSQFVREKSRQFFATSMTVRQMPKFVVRFMQYWLLNARERLLMGVSLRYALRPFSIVPFSEDDPKFIHFFDYIEWDSMHGVALLKSELDWQHPDGRDSRFDCSLVCFKNYTNLHEKHITAAGEKYCKFVREGKITREDAVVREEQLQRTVDEECTAVIDRLDLKGYRIPLCAGGGAGDNVQRQARSTAL